MNRSILIFAGAMLLLGCGGQNEDVAASNNMAATPAPESPASQALPAPVADNRQQPVGADGASIAEPFRGTWAEAGQCDDRSHTSRLVISETSLRFYESFATVTRVQWVGPRSINIYVSATGEGTTRPAEYHFSINPSADTLTDEAGGGMVRRRCEG